MAYCTEEHVVARNPVRGDFTASTHPNATQLGIFIDEIAGEIDSELVTAGYSAPVATLGLASSAAAFLQAANANGAAYKVEWAAPTSDRRGEYEDMYQSALKMIRTHEIPGLAKEGALSLPRAPSEPTPFFTRDMRL